MTPGRPSKTTSTWRVGEASLPRGGLDATPAESKGKYGTPPNIIHITWDNAPVGEVGIPETRKVRGFETPHRNRPVEEGIHFMRTHTEPLCMASRAASGAGLSLRSYGRRSAGNS